MATTTKPDLSNASSRLLEPTKASNLSRHVTVIKEEQKKQEQALLEASSTTPSKLPANNSSRRNHRPSFQGLSIIDETRSGGAQGGSSMNPAQVGALKVRSNRANRRRKTLDVLSATAASSAIRDMIDDANAMGSILKGLVLEGNPEDRLQTVLTKAKERGMCADRIFSFFTRDGQLEITRESFLEALERLGNTIIVLSDDELTDLVKKFDTDGDGRISIAEFKEYCYKIPSLAWKAERQRLERSGMMKKLQAHSSRRFSGLAKEENLISVGEQCFRTSKLFWRTNTTVEIRIYDCRELDMLTMQIYDATNKKEMPLLHICKTRCEATLLQIQQQAPRPTETAALAHDAIGRYLVARLKLRHASQAITEDLDQSTAAAGVSATDTEGAAEYVPFLCKLSGDDWNESLILPKPANLAPPPTISETKASDAEKAFEQAIKGMTTATRRARTSRQSAQNLECVLSDVLAEIEA